MHYDYYDKRNSVTLPTTFRPSRSFGMEIEGKLSENIIQLTKIFSHIPHLLKRPTAQRFELRNQILYFWVIILVIINYSYIQL